MVTDSDNGCSVTSADVVITQDILDPTVTVSPDATELTCANTDVVISSTPTVQGTASYLWSNGATTQNITVTIPGTYSVVVTDSDNGCSVTSADVVITQDILDPTVTVSPDATELTCANTDVVISSTPTVQGTASYLWSNGATTQNITVTTPGTYSVVVTDSDNGCSVTSADVVITQDILDPTVTVSPDATELTCANTDVVISSTPTVQGTASYLWSNGATTQNITVTTPGTYSVVVTDSDNGCSVTSADVVITQDILDPTVTVSPDATELTCANTDVVISSTPTVQGTASYLWSNGATTQNITVTIPGTYSVTVTDSDNGCSVTSADVVITQDILDPTVTVSPDATELTCADTSIVISSTPTVQGTASYLWSNGATTQNITVTTPGTYSVVVTDSDNGCSVTSADVVITQDIDIPTAEAGPTGELTCAVTTLTLDGTGSTTTGVSYLWTTSGTGVIDSGATTLSPVISGPGTYTLTVTNTSTGCFATDTVTITEDILDPTVTVSPDATELTCANTDVVISSTPTVQGTASYLWSNGATTQNITVTTPGTYSVVVTDSDNGCSVTSADVVITQDILDPTVTVSPDATELTCANTDVVISSTPTVQGTASYLWSNGATTQNITVTIPGTYSVTVTDSDNGCSVTSADVVITQDTVLPVIDSVVPMNPTTASCPALDDGSITITATGSNLEYSIDGGATYQSSNVFNGLVAGSYTVAVINTVTGCETISATATVLTAPGCVPSLVVVKTQTAGAESGNGNWSNIRLYYYFRE